MAQRKPGVTEDDPGLRRTVAEESEVAVVAGEPLAALDYASCADIATLAELAGLPPAGGPALLSIAALIGSVRLIDNEPLQG